MSISCREILQSSPTYQQVLQCLLEYTASPVAAKLSTQDALIARTIVTEIVPNFWPLAASDEVLRLVIIKALASLAGVNALLAQRNDSESIAILQLVIESQEFSLGNTYNAWHSGSGTGKLLSQPDQLWMQYVALTAGGKILNLISEATTVHKVVVPGLWLDRLHDYCTMLGRQVVKAASTIQPKSVAVFIGRAMSLGDQRAFLSPIINSAISSDDSSSHAFSSVRFLTATHQLQFLLEILDQLQDAYLNLPAQRSSPASLTRDVDRIGALSTVILRFISDSSLDSVQTVLKRHASRYNTSVRRALVLSISKLPELLPTAQSCLEIFADSMYIRHSTIIAQEALAETLLLICAYLNAEDLTRLSKSVHFTEAISNHLESTTDRIRFLGMIVGEAVSAQVIADVKKRLTFGVPDTTTDEAIWWKALIEIEDEMKDEKDLSSGIVQIPTETVEASTAATLDISELIESDIIEDEDEEFTPMRIPDSDDEDSDEDPSMVEREKLAPPVYIRDLLSMLRNHESFKHISLGLRTASALIRRKAKFGTELEDYAIDLARAFTGLQDNFDMEDFQALRQEALVSLVVSCPIVATPFLTQTFFKGDYSLQQRTIILSAIGLGAREIAGASEPDAKFENLFVSKRLPAAQEQLFALQQASDAEQQRLLGPITDKAIDATSGPAILQVSSKRPARQVLKKIPSLPQEVAHNMFFPLIGQFATHSGKLIQSDATTFYEANLLTFYLRTLALTYQVSSSSPSFSRMTSEFWDLLQSLRTHSDRAVLEAILFGLLVIIEGNSERHLAMHHAHALAESQEWCAILFQRGGEDRVVQLSAGILIRIRDIIENQRVLMNQGQTLVSGIGRGRFGIAGLK